MHGRVKVKTSAEQAAAKEKERQKRAAKYLAVRNAIVAKRAAGGEDEAVLAMTTGLLSTLPDFATMWNWRRECLERKWAGLSNEEKQKECAAELVFLTSCLKENPKSYSVWHQRRWVVLRSPTPPWESELENCNLFLKLDQRNFHGWDYRRFVVAHSTHPSAAPEAEFAYSLEKISENFSNYSAWHYRSTLLPVVRPAAAAAAVGGAAVAGGSGAVAADALAEEFETVASAFYIDPCDQSAWIYHRWLLGREANPPSVCAVHPGDGAAAATLVFSHPVRLDPAKASVMADGAEVGVEWAADDGRCGARASGGGGGGGGGDVGGANPAGDAGDVAPGAPSALWTARLVDPSEGAAKGPLTVRVAAGGATGASATPCEAFEAVVPGAGGPGARCASGRELLRRLAKYRLPSADLLEEQLAMCEELMQELDEGSEQKWALLATVYILHGIDPTAHHDRIVGTLRRLAEIDPNRKGYYDDARSGHEWEWAASAGGADDAAPASGRLVMSGKALTSTHHLAHFSRVTHLDLSSNALRALEGLRHLRAVTELVLDDNALPGFYDGAVRALPALRVLSARNNRVRSARGLDGLRALPACAELRLGGNPVCALPEFAEFAAAHLPYLARDE